MFSNIHSHYTNSSTMALVPIVLAVLLLQISAAKVVQRESVKNSIRPAKNDALAFSAELSDDYAAAPGETIVFDRTITNLGELYFDETGQFACPDGLWVFTWNLAKAYVAGLDGMRAIGSLRTGTIDRKYGPKTSYRDITVSGVSEMTAIIECTTSPPTVVTIAAQPWAGDVANTTWLYRNVTSFSGFKLPAGIAFTAENSIDQYALPDARVMFKRDLINEGDHYEPLHGYFRCPDDGVYVFSVSTHTRDPATPWSVSRLMMEDVVVMHGPMTFRATSTYDSGSSSMTAVLQCTPDFSVYVEAQVAHDFHENSYGQNLTSFTGFKLYDVTADTVAFFAALRYNFTAFESNAPLPFDDVITNIGSAYNVSNSRFVCPDDEYYLFTWTATMTVGTAIDLHMDGSFVKRLTVTSQSSAEVTGTSGSCTQSTILQCQAGSMLQVVTVATGSDYKLLRGSTSFSGYKLPG